MRRTITTSMTKTSKNYNIIILIWIFFIMLMMFMFTGCSALGCDCNCDSQLSYLAIRSSDLPFVGCFFTDNSALIFGNVKSENQNYAGANCLANSDTTYCGCDNETTENDENINIVVCGEITQKTQLGFSYDYDEISSCYIGCVDGCLCLSIDSDDRFGYIIPEAYNNDKVSKYLDMRLGRTDCMGNEL